jgi:O-antigen ligase
MRTVVHSENIRLSVFLGLLVACFLFGGASRVDAMSLIFLQPVAALCVLVFLLTPGAMHWGVVKVPLLLLGALAGTMAAQLVPLPPEIWTKLAGHSQFVGGADLAGIAQPWRPISLTPDLTLASLVGLIVPIAVLVGFASIAAGERRMSLTAMLAGIGVSAIFGLAQVSGGPQSSFYLYDVTNLGNAVGLFANRNHQALLLCMAWPMLVAWELVPHKDPRRRVAGRWIAVCSAIFILPLLIVTGSRAGIVLGVASLGFSAVIWWRAKSRSEFPEGRFDRFIIPAVLAGATMILVATVALSRAEAIQRLLNLQALEDARVETTPTILKMAADFFPVGSGFGSFDPVYRYYEPFALLSPRYLNHAHNDLLELIVSAGLPGVILLALFLVWFGRHAWLAWFARDGGEHVYLARVASVIILLTLMSSLVDYPLRTPLIMAVFGVACGWLALPMRVRVGS